MCDPRQLDFLSPGKEQLDTDEFDGETCVQALDGERLSSLMGRVYALMGDGKPRTLREIADACAGSEASVSARIRDLRKERFRKNYPNSEVITERVEGQRGLHRYRVVVGMKGE